MSERPLSEVDRTIERANAALERARTRETSPAVSGRQHRAQIRRAQRFAAILGGGFAAILAVVIGWSLLFGVVSGLGILMLILAALAVFVVAGVWSRDPDIEVSSIARGSLPAIVDKTDRWLSQQRAALPAPAQTLSDQLGARIAALQPQLATIDEGSHEARELRRLMGDELPDLVTKYRQVPKHLQREERNGRVPEQELVEGLRVLDQQIADVSRNMGVAQMDQLSSQKRYLELRYQDDETPGT